MGFMARAVFFVLLFCSIYMVTVTIERLIVYRKARKTSVLFAVEAAQRLRENNPDAVIELAKKYRHSHLAKVTSAGLFEFTHSDKESALSDDDVIAASRRAIDRTVLVTTAELKRGIGGLATIATTAPFIGLFGTVVGIINAFHGMALSGSGGIGAVSAGIAEALVMTAFGLLVAIPAVWMFNTFTNKIERFSMEMSNASSELIDFFIKKHAAERE